MTSSVGLTCTPGEIPTIIGHRAAVINNNQLIDRHDVHGTCTDLDMEFYAKQYLPSQLVPTLQPHARPPLSSIDPKVRALFDFSSCDSDTFSISTDQEVTHIGFQSTSSTTTTSLIPSSAVAGDLKTSSSAVQQFRSPRSSSAAAVLPVWSPAATACDVALSTMSHPVSACRQPSLSSPMSTAPLPSLSAAAVWSTPIRSTCTSTAPITTLTLPSTTAGHCQSGLTSLPPPVHAVPTLHCTLSSSVAADSSCFHVVQQSPVNVDSREISLSNDS